MNHLLDRSQKIHDSLSSNRSAANDLFVFARHEVLIYTFEYKSTRIRTDPPIENLL